MGWLRDLMDAATPRCDSFGTLARQAKTAPGWPSSLEIQPRSLATLLSKLDRGEQLQWLADRPEVQRVLCEVLSAPQTALRGPLESADPTPASDPRLLRLRDLPGARPLDLVREMLPPGIPERLQRPDGPPLWWVAPSASGRSLTGAWLLARGRAAFLVADRWEDLQGRIPDGPVFVEITGASSAEPKPRAGLCVAAPFEPQTPGFDVIRSPNLSEVLRPLVDWSSARLPLDTRLTPEIATETLSARISDGTIQTLGDVFGWLGLLDEIGPRAASKPVERLARRFVENRVGAHLDPGSSHASWLQQSLYPLALGLIERTFTDSDCSAFAERSFEQWMSLVPPEVERAVDVEWMRLSLARIDSAIRPADLDRAARQLPPGAFRMLTALEESGLLSRTAQGRCRLQPVWWVRALAQQAIRSLVERSPFEWGEALLQGHAAPSIARALLERTLSVGSPALEPVLELEADDQPAYAAAVELAFRVAGVGRLIGVEFGQELLDGLLSEMERLVLHLPGSAPIGRIDLIPSRATCDFDRKREGRALLEEGTLWLAALSITEVATVHAPHFDALNPWRGTTPSPVLGTAYDAILRSLESGPRWQAATFSLIGRVRRVVGSACDPETPHPLEQPAQILDEAQLAVLSWSTLAAHSGDAPGWVSSLMSLARERHIPLETLLPAIWRAWDEAGRPDNAGFLAPTAPEHALFWTQIPETLLGSLLVDDRRYRVPYAVFGPEQWRAFARAVSKNHSLLLDLDAWQLVPEAVALPILESDLPWHTAPSTVGVLWQRFPVPLRSAARRRLEGAGAMEHGALELLLKGLPTSEANSLMEDLLAKPLPRLGPGAVAPLRNLLHRLIRERAPGWRDAYRMLSELERELRRVFV